MKKANVVIGKIKKRIPLKQLLDGIESEDARKTKRNNNISAAALFFLMN